MFVTDHPAAATSGAESSHWAAGNRVLSYAPSCVTRQPLMTLPPTERDGSLQTLGNTPHSLRAFDALALHLEPLTRTLDTIAASNIGAAMRQMQKQQTEVNQLLKASLVPNVALSNSIRQMHELSLQTSTFTAILKQAHNSWLNDLHGAAIAEEHLANVAKLALSGISYNLAALTECILPSIDFDVLRKHFSTSLSLVPDVQLTMSNLLTSYDGLIRSFQSIEHVVQLPSFVLPGASRELSATGYAIDVICPSDDRRGTERIDREIYSVVPRDIEDSSLVALLEQIGPEFVMMYRGAVTALSDSNPDRSRHVLTSLRELWNHLLRRLAPQEEVRAWALKQRDGQVYLRNGEPTLRAKLGYVLKGLSVDPLRRFVEADTKSMMELYTLYNRLHGLDTGLTDKQLYAITLKTESHLVYILQVRKYSVEKFSSTNYSSE